MEDDIKHTAGQSKPASTPRLDWLVLLFGILFSVIAWRTAVGYEQRLAQARFETDALERSLLIRKQFETTSAALEDLASLFAVTSEVTGEKFSRFVGPILARQAPLKALSWNPLVTAADRAGHEAAIQAEGQADYRITQRSTQGDLVPAAARDRYVVVAAIEPFEDNRSALGFDISSEQTRNLALQRARDTAALAIAAPIVLVQSDKASKGALAMLPRYTAGSSLSTIEERRDNLQGYFVAVVDIDQAIAAALANLDAPQFNLDVVTTPPGAQAESIFSSPRVRDGDGTPGFDSLPHYATQFGWGGHDIDLRFTAPDAYAAAGRTWVPLGVLLGGLLVSALGAAIVFVLRGRTERIAREVTDRTAELRDANRGLEAEVTRRTEVEKKLEEHQHDLERLVAERGAELKTATTQLRSILESEPECVKILSQDGKLEDMNAAGLAMIEADSLEQVRGCDVYALIASRHRAAFVDLNHRVINGESCTLEFELNGLGGGRRWVETHAVPLLDPDGGPTRHLAITRDITEKKNARREQAKLEAQLRHARKLESIGVMAGGIAHDFNNFLQVIIGNSELALGDDTLSVSTRQSIEDNHSAALHAARLCDQMLTYAGRSRPDVQPLQLPQLVASTVELLRASCPENIKFSITTDDHSDIVEGDDAQLRRILTNLLTNASEAIGTRPGRIDIAVETISLPAKTTQGDWIGTPPDAGHYVRLEVADTGCGMDAETRERMFDPFFSTKFTGRGLGLSSTLGIVQSHRGFLKVDSAPGSGTRFTVLFPAATIGDQAPAAEVAAKPASFTQTIMLVDDEEPLRKVGGKLLEKLGCRVVLASAGEEAVARLREQAHDIQVVLLDVAMPGMNGNETCAALRRIQPDIPVIFCSGYADDVVQDSFDSRAYTGFLHKPYRREDLVEILHEALAYPAVALSGRRAS